VCTWHLSERHVCDVLRGLVRKDAFGGGVMPHCFEFEADKIRLEFMLSNSHSPFFTGTGQQCEPLPGRVRFYVLQSLQLGLLSNVIFLPGAV
jgi:hypothetical protein